MTVRSTSSIETLICWPTAGRAGKDGFNVKPEIDTKSPPGEHMIITRQNIPHWIFSVSIHTGRSQRYNNDCDRFLVSIVEDVIRLFRSTLWDSQDRIELAINTCFAAWLLYLDFQIGIPSSLESSSSSASSSCESCSLGLVAEMMACEL